MPLGPVALVTMRTMVPRKQREKAPPAKTQGSPSKRDWIATYYKAEDGRAPARDALRSDEFPKNVRLALEARAKAVRDAPPPSFPVGSPMWSALSKDREKGKVDMSGIFEIRDKQGDTLTGCSAWWTAMRNRTAWKPPPWSCSRSQPSRSERPCLIPHTREVRAQADRYFATSPRPVILPPEI